MGSTAQPPSLPTELWAKVAGFMSNKDWAKASATCRATKAVEMQKIYLSVMQPGVVRWLAAHMGGARIIELYLGENKGMPWCIPRDSPPLSLLLVLRVHSIRAFSLENGHRVSEFSLAARQWLTWMLLRSTNLTNLDIACQRGLAIPPLRNLLHLNLTCVKFSTAVLHPIQQLSQLKTLRLKSSKNAGSDDGLFRDTLDLTGLQLLDRVSIEHMWLRVLCRGGCLVHLLAFLPDMERYGYVDVEGIHALFLHDALNTHDALITRFTGVVLPPYFLRQCGCKILQWSFRGDLCGATAILQKVILPIWRSCTLMGCR